MAAAVESGQDYTAGGRYSFGLDKTSSLQKRAESLRGPRPTIAGVDFLQRQVDDIRRAQEMRNANEALHRVRQLRQRIPPDPFPVLQRQPTAEERMSDLRKDARRSGPTIEIPMTTVATSSGGDPEGGGGSRHPRHRKSSSLFSFDEKAPSSSSGDAELASARDQIKYYRELASDAQRKASEVSKRTQGTSMGGATRSLLSNEATGRVGFVVLGIIFAICVILSFIALDRYNNGEVERSKTMVLGVIIAISLALVLGLGYIIYLNSSKDNIWWGGMHTKDKLIFTLGIATLIGILVMAIFIYKGIDDNDKAKEMECLFIGLSTICLFGLFGSGYAYGRTDKR
jgi:heme/copper-type cytochrome/quinol oxidase subunit 4